ncbi:MAG: hypothetical protein K9M11_00565 [Candidatus Pacebacteria bacterium]|nr:hypothetical protein [Candidatus Paceibacterota bacterium]
MIIYANLEKLEALLNRVIESSCSDFYKKNYLIALGQVLLKNKNNLSFNNSSELVNMFEKLPFLMRQNITSTHPNERLYINRDQIEFISYTSGTTDGKPLILYWGHVDNYFYDPSLGLDVQNILILHPALNKNFGHTFVRQCREAKKPLTPIFADYQNLEQSAVLASATSADTIYTTPTLAEHIADHINKKYDSHKIKLLVLFSETLTSTKRKVLESRYPNAKIANVYASSEIGQILMYPSIDDIQGKIDLMHMQTEAVVAAELIDGELILTMEQNKAFPLIRYKTGDFFKIFGQDPEDSKDSARDISTCPILQWDGRMDVDKIRVNGLEIKSEDIEQALSSCRNDIGTNYQFHFYSALSPQTNKETIKIVIEISKNFINEFSKREAEEKILQALLDKWYFTANATLQTAVDKGLALQPEIHFVENLSVQTQKTRHIVSHIK